MEDGSIGKKAPKIIIRTQGDTAKESEGQRAQRTKKRKTEDGIKDVNYNNSFTIQELGDAKKLIAQEVEAVKSEVYNGGFSQV